MKQETEQDRAALIRLKFFEDRVEGDRDTLARHERELIEERAKYALARPLTEAERDMLAERVAAGGALCCADGRAWLEERLPAPWARAINGWAYENLSCDPTPWLSKVRADRVRQLKLNEFP